MRRYRQALAAGDVRALHILTSRLSSDYSPTLSEFLVRAKFGSVSKTGESVEAAVPLRFVPRSFLRSIAAQRSPVAGASFGSHLSIDGIARNVNTLAGNIIEIASDGPFTTPFDGQQTEPSRGEMGNGANWVVLTEPSPLGPLLSGVLHHEYGKWRMVSGASPAGTALSSLTGLFVVSRMAGSRGASPATVPIDRLVAARDAGARFLRLWAENRPEAMLKQTAMASFAFAGNLTDYKRLQERRPDQGNCPLNPGD